MFLAFQITDIITVPFGYLLSGLYQLTNNYGVAMILFALIVQTVLLPIRIKSKKSMMKISRLTPLTQKIQAKYPDDQAKQNEAIQKLYKDEGVSMTGGCLWSFVPLLILWPLFAVIRQPITYILMESEETATKIVETIQTAAPDLFSGNSYYNQVVAAQAIPQFVDELREAIPEISEATLAGINFSFLGIDLGSIPSFNVFKWESVDWAHIGLFLIPLLSTGSQLLQMWISQRMNNSVVTDENGVQDKEAVKNSQSTQTNQIMMIMLPLMTLWIGFTVSAGLSLYWFVGGIYSMISDAIMTRHYRKVYDAEDAVRLQKALEREREEAEKERIRAERRAANPDGQTQNTSKKKMQKQQQQAEEAARAAAAREYAARKGLVDANEAETADGKKTSGTPRRPYAHGRNYDPNRYHTTEE